MPQTYLLHEKRPYHAPDEVLAAYAEVGVASIHEQLPHWQLLDPEIRPRGRTQTIAGRALTVQCSRDDNLALHAALHAVTEGDVLAISGTSGCWGGQASHAAAARGCAGVVTSGLVRDTDEYEVVGLGVWSRGVSPRGAAKNGPGALNVPVAIGGVVIFPGDLVVADADGVIVVPGAEAQSVLDGTRERERAEQGRIPSLDAGEGVFDRAELDRMLEPARMEWSVNAFRPPGSPG